MPRNIFSCQHSFHHTLKEKKPLRFCFSKWWSFTCVAIPAWSVPGNHKQFRPFILQYRVIASSTASIRAWPEKRIKTLTAFIMKERKKDLEQIEISDNLFFTSVANSYPNEENLSHLVEESSWQMVFCLNLFLAQRQTQAYIVLQRGFKFYLIISLACPMFVPIRFYKSRLIFWSHRFRKTCSKMKKKVLSLKFLWTKLRFGPS